jgi:hypothetical protein
MPVCAWHNGPRRPPRGEGIARCCRCGGWRRTHRRWRTRSGAAVSAASLRCTPQAAGASRCRRPEAGGRRPEAQAHAPGARRRPEAAASGAGSRRKPQAAGRRPEPGGSGARPRRKAQAGGRSLRRRQQTQAAAAGRRPEAGGSGARRRRRRRPEAGGSGARRRRKAQAGGHSFRHKPHPSAAAAGIVNSQACRVSHAVPRKLAAASGSSSNGALTAALWADFLVAILA